jgi:hypothetical protein
MNLQVKRFRRSPFLRLGIVSAAAALATLACGLPGSATATPTPAPGGIPAGWICYTDTTYGFEVCYPPDATIDTASPEHSRIDLAVAPGTTLESKEMDVDAAEGLTVCESPQTAGYAPGSITGTTQTIGTESFLVQTGEQGTAGHLHRWTGYSTQRGDVCVSLTGILHSANPMVFSTPPPEYDVAAEGAVFEQIVATFHWLEVPAPTSAATVPPGWVCYQNALYSFEVCYPADATLSGETPDHVRINLTVAPGTNLIEKWMDVDGRTTPPDCGSPQASGYDPSAVDSSHHTYAGLDFLVQHASEGAAGSIYEWTGYSTERTGVCASLTGVLHSGQIGNYATPPAEFDNAAESAVFVQIVGTFRWLGAPTPTPAQGAAVATLTETANCRRGASLQHEIVTFLKKGVRALIFGRNEDASWWLVQVPNTTVRCWVWSGYVRTTGNLVAVPFVESPVLGCWYRGARDKKSSCVAPCPEGGDVNDVCQP